MEEYIDGIDDNNGSLKYEKTQNRDIMRTIERINRSEKFKDSANDVAKLVSNVLKGDSERILCEIWSEKHESKTPPNGLSISVDIVPPVHKKVHPEGDTDTFFKPYKDYPFYYVLNLKISAKFTPSQSDPMKDDEGWYGRWFIDNIMQEYSKKIAERAKEALDSKFSNIFSFPCLSERSDDSQNILIKDGVSYDLDRINVVVSPVLKFNRTNDDSSGVNSRFDSTEDMKNILVSSIAMALERIIHV